MRSIPIGLVLVLVLLAGGCGSYGNWPDSNTGPVEPLAHPDLETAAARLPGSPADGFTFAAYGDQRALADGEWQAMTTAIASRATDGSRLLCVIDTGDIVDDGRFADQFSFLARILTPLRDTPYLVAIGNHEIHKNDTRARAHTARFVASVAPELSVDRLYFRKDAGPVSFLFLDTNDLVYGPEGDRKAASTPAPGDRAAQQLDWLVAQLDGTSDEGSLQPTVVALLHHPFLQSSEKHHAAAASLWNLSWAGRRLPDLLLHGGVDIVVVGHTHTYEHFHLQRRADGRTLRLLNLSGRPRPGFLFFGAGARRAQDIRGREIEWLAAQGWQGIADYEVIQVDAMTGQETNQYGWFVVDSDGGMSMELNRQDPEDPAVFRSDAPVALTVAGGAVAPVPER